MTSNGNLDASPSLLTGTIRAGQGRTWTMLDDSGNGWPESTRLTIEDHAGVEQTFVPVISGPNSELATWQVTVAETDALIFGAKIPGALRAQITTGTGDALRPVKAGHLSIVNKWYGVSGTQSLGTVTLGPPGPGIASGAVDDDGALVLTLDNAVTLDPITLPPVVALAIDADGDYYPAAGTDYVLVSDADGDYDARELA